MPESDKILPTGTMHPDLTRPLIRGVFERRSLTFRELASCAATSKDATTAASRDRMTSNPSSTGTTASRGTLSS